MPDARRAIGPAITISTVGLLVCGSSRVFVAEWRANVTRIRCLHHTRAQPIACELAESGTDRAGFHEGLNQLFAGRADQAAATLRTHVDADPGDVPAAYFLGIAYR